MSPSTVSNLNQKIYSQIEAWRHQPIEGEHPYLYLDGIVLKRSWAGEGAQRLAAGCDRRERARLPGDWKCPESFRIFGLAERHLAGSRGDGTSHLLILQHAD